MRTAFMCVDVVRECEDLFLIAVVVLKRYLQINAFAHALEVNDSLMQGRLVLVQVLYERNNATCVMKLMLLLGTLIFDRDQDTFVQECELAKPLRQDIEIELSGLKDLRVWFECDFCPAAIGVSGYFERSLGDTASVTLNVDFASAPDL